ncbi:MAG: Bacterial domain [Geminicoccaceae bacterium]|nr:Bacterial domain [Geminicoccaceae bacterium]MCE3248061.1 Bacterial domain [Geminicoccaceae bacterium]
MFPPAAGWIAPGKEVRALARAGRSRHIDVVPTETTMRFVNLAGSAMMLFGSVALAAEGDPLRVSGDGVNVRARPESGAPILRQVNREEPVIELGRAGDWFEVRLPDRDTRGWIHGSLLTTVEGQPVAAAAATPPAAPVAPSPAPQVAPRAVPEVAAAPPAPVATAPQGGASAGQDQPGAAPMAAAGDAATADALTRFRATVTQLNDRAVAAAGVDLFTGAEAAGDGTVQVTATEAWGVVPEGGQQSFMNTLFGRWQEAAGPGRRLRLQIVDESGQVLSERSGP